MLLILVTFVGLISSVSSATVSETSKKNPYYDSNKLTKYYYDTYLYNLKHAKVYSVDKYKNIMGLEGIISTTVKVKSKSSNYKIKSVKVYYYSAYTAKYSSKTYIFKNKSSLSIVLKDKVFDRVVVTYNKK
ncbi:hypothetical protein [Methanobrevibacter filiformis]|nr:hypothetical protein [Methanobrevibacter filiformis]